MSYVWGSDLHLVHPHISNEQQVIKMLAWLREDKSEALFLTGDIADGWLVQKRLDLISAARKDSPVFFVLGNHDYYRSSRSEVRGRIRQLVNARSNLHWMDESDPIPLGNGVVVVGAEGWGDGGYGVRRTLSGDHASIADLRKLNLDGFWEAVSGYGEESAMHLASQLNDSLQMAEKPSKILVLTHVPPFGDACFYAGQPTEDNALPHFACEATGRVLSDFAGRNPNIEIVVLCGHTHQRASFTHPDHANLRVEVAYAEYGKPVFSSIDPNTLEVVRLDS